MGPVADPGAGRAQAGAYPGHAFGGADLLVEGMGLAEPDHCLALIALLGPGLAGAGRGARHR